LVANELDQIFLESIDATKELAGVEYKRFEINKNGSYARDLAVFFNKTKTPAEIAYAVKREATDFSILNSYQQQIEETYQYGATANYSKLHDENFRIFAPIWLDLNIPKLFVIFKVKNPVDIKGLQDNATNNYTRMRAILANAEIVKTFDLSRTSSLGNYIRNHVQEADFPITPLTFSFEKGEKSTFNGIDLEKGGFTTKAEYLFTDFVQKDKPLIEANDFITDGFKRNKLAVANLLNIEFLFNDPTAEDYSVNRYFGLYVDDIDSGYGVPSFVNSGKINFRTLTSIVEPNIPYSAIPSYRMMSSTPTLGYAKIDGNYFKIESDKLYNETKRNLLVTDTNNKIPSLLGIKPKGVSVNLLRKDDIGFDFVKAKIVDIPVVNDSIALVNIKEQAFRIKFIKHIPNTQVTISDYHGHDVVFNTGANSIQALQNFETVFNVPQSPFGNHFNLSVESNYSSIVITEKNSTLSNLDVKVTTANGNVIRIDEIYTYTDLPNSSFYAAAPGELPKGTFNGSVFSADGTTYDIAIALTAAINAGSDFKAINYGDDIYIKCNVGGYKLLQHALLIKKSNNSTFIQVDNIDTQNTLTLDNTVLVSWFVHFLNGGNSLQRSILVTNETASQIAIGDYLPTIYEGKYNKILDIVEFASDINAGYKKIILTNKTAIKGGETQVYHDNNVYMGLFSAYDIYDMNFDFYDTANSDIKELKYETVENIQYEPYDDAIGLDPEGVFDEDYALDPIEYFLNIQPLLFSEDVFEKQPDKIYTEYDRLKENYTKTWAVRSRVVPNINKWVLNNGLTVREQPYYLNANEAFGKTNFSPDLNVTERDKLSFTHEWFYLDKLPTYFRYDMVNDSFSYVDFVNNLNQGTPFEITKDLFKSVDHDYFDRYMIVDGLEIASDSDNLNQFDENEFDMVSFMKTVRQKKYTMVDSGNDLSFANTVFKGIKVFFKNRKEFEKSNPSDFVKGPEFNGYKFSTLVKVNMGSFGNSIEYDVIQNKKFGFVIFFITLNLTDIWAGDYINRKLLYELNHNIVQDINIGEYKYSDTELKGALALNTVDFASAGPYTVNGISNVNGTDPDFTTQILVNDNDVYGRILIDYNLMSGIIYAVDVVSVTGDTEIRIKGLPYNVNDPSDVLQAQYLTQSQIINASYIYEGGGLFAHSTLLNSLSAGAVANLLTNNDPKIKYITVDVDGTLLENRFVINFDNGKEITKVANLTIIEDENKPKSYKLVKGAIGYEIVNGQTYYPNLIRHSGNYTIDMRPVVTFTDLYTHFKVNREHTTLNPVERSFKESLYKHSLTDIMQVNIAAAYYKRFNRIGTSFNLGFIQDNGTHDGTWGLIKNHFYHKVNEINPSSVTKLTSTSEFLPEYPLIGEIAIDKKDVNVFRSSWDSFYYTRSLAGGKSELVPGTLDTIEERSYLASTMMQTKPDYILITFTQQYVNTEEELDSILKNSNNTTDTVIFEDKERIIIDFYMGFTVFKTLKDSGVLDTLTRFVMPEDSLGDKTTLIDDAESYVFKNLLNLYSLSEINLYTRAQKEGISNIVFNISFDNLTQPGYVLDPAFTYKLHTQSPLNFRLIYNKRLGYSYDIKPMVKIKS